MRRAIGRARGGAELASSGGAADTNSGGGGGGQPRAARVISCVKRPTRDSAFWDVMRVRHNGSNHAGARRGLQSRVYALCVSKPT